MVEGFIELDQMRSSNQEEGKRTENEITRLRNALMSTKVGEASSKSDGYWLKKLLSTKADLNNLLELNFKSRILLKILTKTSSFEVVTTRIIFQRKRAERQKQRNNNAKEGLPLKPRRFISVQPTSQGEGEGKEEGAYLDNSNRPERQKVVPKQGQNQKSQKKSLVNPKKINIRKKILSREGGSKRLQSQQQTPQERRKIGGNLSISFQKRQVRNRKPSKQREENMARFIVEEGESGLEGRKIEPRVEIIKIDEGEEFEPGFQK